MHPLKMKVINRIKDGRRVVAEPGTILHVVPDYKRIGGVLVLRKASGKYVCDYGSAKEKECCQPLNA